MGALMGELLFGYLVHHAYWDTAAAVARDLLDGKAQVASYHHGTCTKAGLSCVEGLPACS